MSHANRGMTWETMIEYALERYKWRGEAVITKQHTKFIPIRNRYGAVVNCKVEQKATVDFMGRYGSIPVVFEAKNTNTNRISFSEVQDHQADFMDDWILDDSAFAMVLVAFDRMERFYAVPWPFWRRARQLWKLERGKKEVVSWRGQVWETTGKASVSPEEMLPEWEIKRDATHGLALLAGIETYFIQNKD